MIYNFNFLSCSRILVFCLISISISIVDASFSLNMRGLQSNKNPKSFQVTLYDKSSTCNGAVSDQTLFIAQQYPFCQRQGLLSSVIVACEDDSRSGKSTVCSDSFCSQNCLSERFISGACTPAGPLASMRIDCGAVDAKPPPLTCGRCTIEYSELSNCIGPDRSFMNVKAATCTRNMDGSSFIVFPVKSSVGLDIFFCSDSDCNTCTKQPLLGGQCVNSNFDDTGAGSLRASCASDCIAASASQTPSPSPSSTVSMSSSASSTMSSTQSSSTSMTSSSSSSASATPSASTSMSSSASSSASATPSASTSMSSSASSSASATPSASTSMSSSASSSASATPSASTSMSSSASSSASMTPSSSSSLSSSSSSSASATPSASTSMSSSASSSASVTPTLSTSLSSSSSSSASTTSTPSSSASQTVESVPIVGQPRTQKPYKQY